MTTPSTPTKVPLFADLGLSDPVMSALKRIGYEQPTPIQEQSIPHLLAGRDILGTAQTGTGKTAAFALPLLSRIDPKKKKPQVLVLAPTRELAIQVAEALDQFMGGTGGEDTASCAFRRAGTGEIEFSKNRPLGRFFLVVAMSVCLCI